jgi:hypothetical protein
MFANMLGVASIMRTARVVIKDLAKVFFSKYQPERHYMRGPGPACAANKR